MGFREEIDLTPRCSLRFRLDVHKASKIQILKYLRFGLWPVFNLIFDGI